MALETPGWWSSLRHGGLLIAPSRLAEHFGEEPEPLPSHLADRLRRDILRLDAGARDADAALLDVVLHRVCGLDAREGEGRWERGTDVDARWSQRAPTGEVVKPRRVWYGPHDSLLPVFVDEAPRLGIGHGRRSVSRVLYWLRASQRKLALLTNANQWRLIYAGLDFDAWAEWDTSLWFEEGRPGPQVQAVQALLSSRSLASPATGQAPPLLAAIEASRKGQAELSSELGERVRQAVELLIQALGTRLDGLDKAVTTRDIYIAATRIVMRMVVLLFAEARDLLPRANEVYHASYGLQGLRELLDRSGGATGHERLRQRWGAWPRLLALFRLVHEGSHHEALPVPRYGGDLFGAGDSQSESPVLRALAALEAPSVDHPPNDAVVQQVLELLCRSRVKVRQGKVSTWVYAPVDFSDLSSEYIGILYEGLLDYELRRADEPMVFLALGDEPLLPLSRLEAMDDSDLRPLVEKLKVKQKAGPTETEEETEQDDAEDADDEAAENGGEPDEVEEGEAAELDAPVAELNDAHHTARERAWAWARRAVAVGKLVAKSKSKKAEAQQAYEETIERVARSLVRRVVLPSEWFLVRWGGTRKGAGTFYTRPQLAVPTAQRTLRPLAFDPPAGPDGEPDENAPAARWTPKRPEEVLALRVCDPAVGSGSFLIASLRFLTEALYLSLHHHGRIKAQGETTLVTLAEGKPSGGRLAEELLPCRPDDDDFEVRLRARLKRYIVERCLYGVDIDPLAAELARLALWIETMEKDLPFEFLDHKVKVGNSLVGCWFDRFRDYPALAWDREGGDKGHGNGVHFKKEAWTKLIGTDRKQRIKPELAAWILGQRSLLDAIEGRTPEAVHDEALAAFDTIHSLPVHEAQERERLYRERLQGNSALLSLRHAFDTWCAIWFWPADDLKNAPTPRTFDKPSEATREGVRRLAAEHNFFHWELEFPDVFTGAEGGFAALVGNPPWETLQPNSKEYFSNIDPLYRTYGKQNALARQAELFEESADQERRWIEYNARFKAFSNWMKYAGEPFGDAEGEAPFLGKGRADLHAHWREGRTRRTGYSDARHPFRLQGEGKPYTYRMFLELSHTLLRSGGQLGMLVPSGAYADKGSASLRTLFLNGCRWRWLFGFENRQKIFDIDSRFKFGPVVVQKDGTTNTIRTAFMRRDLADWENAEAYAVPYGRAQIERFSPKTKIIVEFESQEQADLASTIYSHSHTLAAELSGEALGLVSTSQGDINLTSEVKKAWHQTNIDHSVMKLDEYGRLMDAESLTANPVYQGAMIHQFNPLFGRYSSGFGHKTSWEPAGWQPGGAQFWLPVEVAGLSVGVQARLLTRRLINATNERSMIAAVIPNFPSSDTTLVWELAKPTVERQLLVSASLNSYVFDWCVRSRIAGGTGATALDFGRLEELPVPKALDGQRRLVLAVAELSLCHWMFAPQWLLLRECGVGRVLFALAPSERLRLRCMLDAVIAELFGLSVLQLRLILADCDHPVAKILSQEFYRTLNQKGFWRVDKDKDPELRHSVLTLVAFDELKEAIAAFGGDRDRGIAAFCAQNEGDGWLLPETLRLSDHGLGHDGRAQRPQPVRDRLGPRFLPWQLEQSADESWAECERHARKILGADGFAHLAAELRAGEYAKDTGIGVPNVAGGGATSAAQGILFAGPKLKGRP